MEIRRLSILGLGLLGGSLGLAVKEAASTVRVVGYAHRKSTLEKALDTRVVDEGFDDPVKAVTGADVIVLCTPVGTFEELLRQIGPAIKRGGIVTDVGSTKATVVEAAERALPGGVRFVGSHPMAGSERRGVDFAIKTLYKGALCIVTPAAKTDPVAVEAVEGFWKSLGMRTTRVAPAEHDRLLAAVSHLPHAVAAALVAVQPKGAVELAGKGFMDSTRIAAGDAGLWRDIFMDNRENLLGALRRMRAEVEGFEKVLEAGDTKGVEAWLARWSARRAEIGQKITRGAE